MAYLKAYENILGKFRNKKPFMIEIGCGYPKSHQPEGALEMGGSLELFSSWLGQGSKILGIDILEDCISFQDPKNNIFIEIGSQDDENFLASIIDRYGEPDIILDDGSHIDRHINKTFDFLFPHLKTDGVYIIEDIGGNHLSGEPEDMKSFYSEDRALYKAFSLVQNMNQYYAKSAKSKQLGLNDPVYAENIGFLLSQITFIPNAVIINKSPNVPIDQMVSPAHYAF